MRNVLLYFIGEYETLLVKNVSPPIMSGKRAHSSIRMYYI